MTGELTLFTLDSDGFGVMIALMIVSGVVALVCMFISVISMFSSKWETASALSIITALFGFPWVMINPIIIVLVILYPILVCSAAYFIGTKKKKELSEQKGETSNDESKRGEGE